MGNILPPVKRAPIEKRFKMKDHPESVGFDPTLIPGSEQYFQMADAIVREVNGDNDLRNTKLVSVGSGNGTVEHYIQSKLSTPTPIICIDPEPESWSGAFPTTGKFIPPMFGTVSEALIGDTLDLVDQCTLMMIWPNPPPENAIDHGSPNEDDWSRFLPYDLEAIQKLRPKTIFIYYDATGSSGSSWLQTWLDPALSNQRKYGPSPLQSSDWRFDRDKYQKHVLKLALPEYTKSQTLYEFVVEWDWRSMHRVLLRLDR